jgi:hypothetical protein
MKTHLHTIALPDGATLAATITVYGPRDAVLPQHDDLYRPDKGVWAVAEIDHPAFKHRVWTVATNSAAEARQQLRTEVETKGRELLECRQSR